MSSHPTYAEQIIKKMKELKDTDNEDFFQVENDIEKGYIIVKYEKLELEKQTLLDGRIDMCMPKVFLPMEEELIVVKYPDEDRPQWIYTNEDTSSNMTFSIEEGEVSNHEIEEMRDLLAQQIKRLYPASPIEDKESIVQEERVIAYFSFQVPLLDGESYNLMFFTALKEGLLIGSFNCSSYEKKQWKPIIKQLLGTLEEHE